MTNRTNHGCGSDGQIQSAHAWIPAVAMEPILAIRSWRHLRWNLNLKNNECASGPINPTQLDKYDYVPLLQDVDPIECNIWRRVLRVQEQHTT
jgi:hypothetical protein